MHNEALAYFLLALVGIVGLCVTFFSLRYTRYLKRLRSGVGRRPDEKVWKPFWFT